MTTPPRAPPYPHHRAPVASRPPPSPAPLWTACPRCPATAPAPAPPPPPSRSEGPPPLAPGPAVRAPEPTSPSSRPHIQTRRLGLLPPLAYMHGPDNIEFFKRCSSSVMAGGRFPTLTEVSAAGRPGIEGGPGDPPTGTFADYQTGIQVQKPLTQVPCFYDLERGRDAGPRREKETI